MRDSCFDPSTDIPALTEFDCIRGFNLARGQVKQNDKVRKVVIKLAGSDMSDVSDLFVSGIHLAIAPESRPRDFISHTRRH